jgi:hypothetical protein
MQIANIRNLTLGVFCAGILAGCGASPDGNMSNRPVNVNVNSNANTASNISNSNTATTSVIDAREPEQYQGKVQLSLETIGEAQKATMPTIGAHVARMGNDRAMEFALPNGERVIYLEKGSMNYIVLPNRRQYAELTRDAVGFEIRNLLLPSQIVEQVRRAPGVRLVGDEMINGRQTTKYTYESATNTQTQAGTVETDSFLLVDKETGLPVRSETVAQSSGNVQGYKGLRLVTQMSEIVTTPNPELFNIPTEYQKIDSEQVKAQANMIFSAVAAIVGQVINQAQTQAPTPAGSPTVTPAQ